MPRLREGRVKALRILGFALLGALVLAFFGAPYVSELVGAYW